MIRIFLPLFCAALGFAVGSCSPSQGPLAPAAEAPAPGQPGPRGAETAAAAMPSSPLATQAPAGQPAADAAPARAARAPVERRASKLIGMPVVAADGSALGEVKDIVFDREGQATHLVIAYGTQPPAAPGEIPDGGQPAPVASGPAASSRLTAIPWDAALASIRNGRLVLDGATLRGAPSFTAHAWPNFDDPAWSAASDAYWHKALRAAIAAHPVAPVDSPSRSRARPPRDDQQ